jgi:A/G-specific adenine glycosylase
MLQQTQVARVIPFYRRFVEALPTLEALAAAGEDQVLALWSGLGYYARGRALRRAAQVALERHGGLPADPAALRALPGFGPYTAGAVASIAFALPVPAVDGNVSRVLARLFLVRGEPGLAATGRALSALAEALVDPVRPGDWNQALMELGATTCTMPNPACHRCPLAAGCLAQRAGLTRVVPPARRRPLREEALLACALAERGGRLLLQRRPPGGLFGGLWSLPAVELRRGASPAAALRRALPGLLAAGAAVRILVGPELARVNRTLTHRELTLTAFRCDISGLKDGEGLRWVLRADLERVGIPSAMRALLAVASP